jgi:Peroxidase, family 2
MSRVERAGKPRLSVRIHHIFLTRSEVDVLTGNSPRDGKNLTLPMVENALMTALHMNRHLAGSLTLALRPLCRADGTLDLEDTRRHNIIEHDNSFSRHDFYTGDNYTIQPDM